MSAVPPLGSDSTGVNTEVYGNKYANSIDLLALRNGSSTPQSFPGFRGGDSTAGAAQSATSAATVEGNLVPTPGSREATSRTATMPGSAGGPESVMMQMQEQDFQWPNAFIPAEAKGRWTLHKSPQFEF